MQPELEEGVRRIAEDRTSGSLDLAIAAIDLLSYEKSPPLPVIRELASKLTAAHPDMVAVRNAVQFCLLSREDSDAGTVRYADAVKAFRRFVETSRPRAARQLLKVIDRPVAVATLSHSSSVLEALEHLRGRRQLLSITVLESLPGGEGRLTIEALRASGDTTVLAPDTDLEAVAATADVVLLGADAIYADGGIANKVLSRALAERANAAAKPVYVVAESIKLDHRRKSGEAGISPGSLFEIVPPEFLTAISTERGVLKPAQVAALASPPEDSS